MTNSIRSNLNKDEIISEIKLSMNADYLENKKVFLLVEGNSDVLFLKKFANEDVELLESFSGKQGVKYIVEHFSNDKVIGICDRDYDYAYQNNHIFYYDYSTLEIMIVHNDNVFENVTAEYYYGEMCFNELRIHILKQLCWLSTFRKYSFDKNIGINFNGLSIAELLSNGIFSRERALEKLNLINSKDLREYTELFQIETDNIDNLYNITQGHDFIKAFQKLCQDENDKSDKKAKIPNLNMMESIFRCSFRIEDLMQTQLYKDINGRGIDIFIQ